MHPARRVRATTAATATTAAAAVSLPLLLLPPPPPPPPLLPLLLPTPLLPSLLLSPPLLPPPLLPSPLLPLLSRRGCCRHRCRVRVIIRRPPAPHHDVVCALLRQLPPHCHVCRRGCIDEDSSAPEPDDCEVSQVSQQCLTSTLQPGNSLVCSGYCLYSSSTFFCLTLGAGVQIFTLDTQIGEVRPMLNSRVLSAFACSALTEIPTFASSRVSLCTMAVCAHAPRCEDRGARLHLLL